MNLKEAHEIATRCIQQLQPGCERIHLAGSLRRMCPQANNIEIVCLPAIIEHKNFNLFGEPVITHFLSPVFKDVVENLGKIELGKVGYRYMKIQLPEGIKLDLFTPQRADYYRQLAIRTGNDAYSRWFIASAWGREGWCSTDDGLRKKAECKQVRPNNWKCVAAKPTLPPAWESEEAFFQWLNLTYLPPQLREM